MRALYFSCALAALAGHPAFVQAPAADSRGYMVFFRGTPIGREDITTRTENGDFLISGTGRLSPPLDIVTKRAEVRYGPDWSPRSLELDSVINLREQSIRIAFADGEAKVEATVAGKPVSKVDTVAPHTLVLPNGFFGFHDAVARRLVEITPPAELPVYIAPQIEIRIRVKSMTSERVQTGARAFEVRRYDLAFANPGGDLDFQLTSDALGRLIRLTIPAQALDVVRDDVAASTSRTETYSNPGDEPVTIPGNGFNIAGTLTRPKDDAQAARGGRRPAVVLLSGSGAGDRDGVAGGVPILGQISGALADAGCITLRYDKRGSGQTGGRAESATLADFAEDARAVVRYLQKRKDVDPRRIVVLGHSEGAWVGLLAASREDRIRGVISIAAPATTGAELVLEQQRRALDQLKLSDAERQAKIELQKKIQAAVVSGKGWEDVPADVRKQADTPWFQSLLTFDPAKVIRNVEQPILILHPELDRQVPVEHADTLAELAKKSDSKSVEVITVRGVNHLLVPATTGEVSEYGSLPDRNVSGDVTKAIVDWLQGSFAAAARR
ncbi:MAG: alpha/beta hydrolase family protein [Vicinamibacterales bacterium]